MREIFGESGALVYYFVYWLPPALVGKLAGWDMANLALFGWTMACLFLCILLISRFIGRAMVLVVLSFVMWSGMDIIGTVIVNRVLPVWIPGTI